MSRSAGKTFFTSTQVAQKLFFSYYFWTNWPEVALSETFRMSEQPSSKDDVRRGLGMLPQQAFFAKAPKGDFAKMSEPVQVYTACQFVKGQNMALNCSQFGNNSTMPPVANSFTSRNTLFPYLNLCPTWSKEILYRCRKMTSSQIETKSFHIIFILCYPVITGHCLIHNMVKYKRTLSQENFSVIAFRQELI